MATTSLTSSAPPPADSVSMRRAEEAAPPASASSHASMPCPDPSAHGLKSSVLQNQASAAALYSTNPAMRATEARSVNPLGPDGKLSSAGAATSLKYAKAHELPSFPVVGIDTKSSANTAALLANQNKKSHEGWKPEQSAAAGKAALLANDYKMAPLWQPEASTAGSKAALLAHKDGVKLNLWTPEASAAGNSAANIAMRKKSREPEVSHGQSEQSRKNAFTAATGAHDASRRKRAQSNPTPVELYPDSNNSARNALNAATLAHSPSLRAKPQSTASNEPSRVSSSAMEAARIQHAKSVSRDMYTSTPPVALETDEKKRNDALRASAISMAKKMYAVQQQHIDGAAGQSAARTGATAAHSQQPTSGEGDIKQQAMRYIGIQEAAQKLAQERLAKIGYDENAAYRSYYGYDQPSRSKLSIRRGRNRASSASEVAPANDSDSDEDDFRSRRIRSQMDQLNKQVADLDAKKRNDDRKNLLAAAQRKVQAQMQAQDKKIYDQTGKMSPAMINDWDEKARQRAVANSEARMENHGKVHIGNGKWMDQSDIDAIAQARIQPTLDEITEKTEKRRAEDEKRRAEEEERRLDLEEKRRREKIDKERAAELKAEEKQAKDEEKRLAKTRAAEEKTAVKQERAAEKAKKLEEEKLAKEENTKLKEATTSVPVVNIALATPRNHDDLYQDPTPTTEAVRTSEYDPASPASPTSQENSKGFKSLLGKLKRRSKHNPNSDDRHEEKSSGFVGGAALAASESHPSSDTPSAPAVVNTYGVHDISKDEVNRPANLGDVEPTYSPHSQEDRYSDISSLSSDYGVAEPIRGRSEERIAKKDTTHSGGTEFEEARDHFDEGLAPPLKFTSDADQARKGGSPVRDSKFHEVGI